MTNFETALQTLVGQTVDIRLRVESTTAGETQPFELRCLILEVMSDSFVGTSEGRTVYVPFQAIAYVLASTDD